MEQQLPSNPNPPTDAERLDAARVAEHYQLTAHTMALLEPEQLVEFALNSHWLGQAVHWDLPADVTEAPPGDGCAVIQVCLPYNQICEAFKNFLYSTPEAVQAPLIAAFTSWCWVLVRQAGLIATDNVETRITNALDALGVSDGVREVAARVLTQYQMGKEPWPMNLDMIAAAPQNPLPDHTEGFGRPIVTVLEGENMAAVSHRVYGHPGRWVDIAKANPQLPMGGQLEPGQVLNLPE